MRENNVNKLRVKDFLSRCGTAHAVLILGALLSALGLMSSANAGTIYTYTGPDYTVCGGTYCIGGPYALSVKFETALTGNALDNMSFTNITSTITSYEFTDNSGLVLNNFNNASGQLDIEMSTNGSGNIEAWFAGAYTLGANTQMQTNWNSPRGLIPGADFSETAPNFAGDFGWVRRTEPGTWGVAASTIPEPSTFVLLGAGLLFFGSLLSHESLRAQNRRGSRSAHK
jgi:hypothetical protein